MEIILTLFKLVLLYFIIIVTYHLMGKRNISELSITDLIVFLLLSNMITLSIPLSNNSFLYNLIAIAFLIFLQTTITYISPYLPSIKYMFNHKGSVIIKNGKLNFKEILRNHYKIEYLLKELKRKNIKRIEDVDYAVLENNGTISFFENEENSTPIPIITDGKIEHLSLKMLHKNESWINKVMADQNIVLDNIFYAFYKQGKLYIIQNTSEINNSLS